MSCVLCHRHMYRNANLPILIRFLVLIIIIYSCSWLTPFLFLKSNLRQLIAPRLNKYRNYCWRESIIISKSSNQLLYHSIHCSTNGAQLFFKGWLIGVDIRVEVSSDTISYSLTVMLFKLSFDILMLFRQIISFILIISVSLSNISIQLKYFFRFCMVHSNKAR